MSHRRDVDLPAVAGNFHVAPGRHLKQANAFQGLDVVLLTFEQFNVSHTVNKIAFGPEHHDEPDSVGREDSRTYRRKKRRRGPPPLLANLTSQLDGQKRYITDGYGMRLCGNQPVCRVHGEEPAPSRHRAGVASNSP